MNCMKCGREIAEDSVFCESCLEDMKKYPIKPGIAIQLPGRKDAPAPRKVHARRRQPPTQEEQIQKLKKRLRRMTVLWLITALLLAAAIYPAAEYLTGRNIKLPGQNYSTITEATQP